MNKHIPRRQRVKSELLSMTVLQGLHQTPLLHFLHLTICFIEVAAKDTNYTGSCASTAESTASSTTSQQTNSRYETRVDLTLTADTSPCHTIIIIIADHTRTASCLHMTKHTSYQLMFLILRTTTHSGSSRFASHVFTMFLK